MIFYDFILSINFYDFILTINFYHFNYLLYFMIRQKVYNLFQTFICAIYAISSRYNLRIQNIVLKLKHETFILKVFITRKHIIIFFKHFTEIIYIF